MIKSLKISPNQFGNKILNFNNLIQIADYLDSDYSCIKWKGCEHFKGIPKQTPKNNNGVEIGWEKIRKMGKEGLKDYYDNLNKDLILKPCLAQLFYVFDGVSTHDFFQIKRQDQLNDQHYNIGVHFRGKDFKKWKNGNGILKASYYINSIEHIVNDIVSKENAKFILFTDDPSLKNYNKVINYLKENNYVYYFGSPNSAIDDFKALSECDAIISNPSTFAITAAMMGKKDKHIIHSDDWRNFIFSSKKNHPIWEYAFTYGGNKNYYINKVIES